MPRIGTGVDQARVLRAQSVCERSRDLTHAGSRIEPSTGHGTWVGDGRWSPALRRQDVRRVLSTVAMGQRGGAGMASATAAAQV